LTRPWVATKPRIKPPSTKRMWLQPRRLYANFVIGAHGASAEVVRPGTNEQTVAFGMKVTLRREDGREQTFRIVGEDEADPPPGTVSHVSPLARAVLSGKPGDTVKIGRSNAIILAVQV
jgi:transcription elongation GreA/GreB family factor